MNNDQYIENQWHEAQSEAQSQTNHWEDLETVVSPIEEYLMDAEARENK